MDMLRNKFTGEIVTLTTSPINHATIVQIKGKSTELHRGSLLTANTFIMGMAYGQPEIWEEIK